MDGGGLAIGGHVLGAAQEPQGQQQQQEQREREEEKKEAGAVAERKKGAGGGGGGMKFRLRARAPHGVGALLLIGGAAVVGAAVLAWRSRSRHGKKKGGAVDQPERRLPAKEEALDGGIVEDGKVQGDSLVQELDQSDEKLSAANTDIGSGTLDGNVLEESHQIHKEDEITADRLENKHEEKIDENSGSNPVEVHTDDMESKHEEKIDENSGSSPVEVNMHDLDEEHVDKVDQKSSSNHVEITVHDMCQDNEHVEKIDHVEGIDQNWSRNPVKIIVQEMVNAGLFTGSVKKVEKVSSKKDIEKEIAQKDNKDMEAPDQSKLYINSRGIFLGKHNDESDGIQEAESMENTPTAQLMMHPDQLLDDITETEDIVTETEDVVTETEEAKKDERTITKESELKQDEKKHLAGLVELARSPALSSLVKPLVKKEPEFPRPNETGMKIEQDYTNGDLRERSGLISKGGAMQGGDMATMDCRSSALVVIALIFALTMGITIIVRLYAPSRATKLQMDLP